MRATREKCKQISLTFALFICELVVRFVIGVIVALNLKFLEHRVYLFADQADRFICPPEV